MAEIYRIRVQGHLADRWSDPLGGLTVRRRDDGTTVLIGPIVDQAALHSVITRIRDLGLELLSVVRVVASRDRRQPKSLTTKGISS